MRLMFLLAVVAIVGYGVMQSPAVSRYGMEQKLGIERFGDWQVGCFPDEPKCQAMLSIEKGMASAKRAQGEVLALRVRVYMTPGGTASADVRYDAKELPRFGHTPGLDWLRIDGGAKFTPACRLGACEVTGGAADRFVQALRTGKSLEVEPREGNAVLVAIHGFDPAWARLQEKAATHKPMDLAAMRPRP